MTDSLSQLLEEYRNEHLNLINVIIHLIGIPILIIGIFILSAHLTPNPYLNIVGIIITVLFIALHNNFNNSYRHLLAVTLSMIMGIIFFLAHARITEAHTLSLLIFTHLSILYLICGGWRGCVAWLEIVFISWFVLKNELTDWQFGISLVGLCLLCSWLGHLLFEKNQPSSLTRHPIHLITGPLWLAEIITGYAFWQRRQKFKKHRQLL